MTAQFMPTAWASAVLRQLQNAPLLPLGPQRRGHSVPPTMEEVTEFEAWDDAFSMIRERGLERGWIDEDGDITPPLGTWVYDEPEDEYARRLKAWQEETFPDGTVTFQVQTKREET